MADPNLFTIEPMKLNLGSGGYPIPGYINIDRAYADEMVVPSETDPPRSGADVYPLPYEDGTVDEVRASHVLEHFSHRQTADVLREWIRVLKPGGMLKIAVPDFTYAASRILQGQEDPLLPLYIMGGHSDGNDHHGAIFDEAGLRQALQALGLVNIQAWKSDLNDCAALPVSLNLQARKPLPNEVVQDIPQAGVSLDGWMREAEITRGGPSTFSTVVEHYKNYQYRIDKYGETGEYWVPVVISPNGETIVHREGFEDTESVTGLEQALSAAEECIDRIDRAARAVSHPDVRFVDTVIPHGDIAAVMTSPRLGFTAFMHVAMNALSQHDIRMINTGGAYWHQGMEDAIQQCIEECAPKYILTLDYDTLFTTADIQTLYGLMENCLDADALVPLQSRREYEFAMFTMVDDEGNPLGKAPYEQLFKDLTPIRSGHFGLTLIRTSALERMQKPWFHAVPAPDGTWGDGRVDADIMFWHRFAAAGNRVFLANRVSVGHCQLMVSWPGRDLQTVHQYTKDYYENGKPSEAWR